MLLMSAALTNMLTYCNQYPTMHAHQHDCTRPAFAQQRSAARTAGLPVNLPGTRLHLTKPQNHNCTAGTHISEPDLPLPKAFLLTIARQDAA